MTDKHNILFVCSDQMVAAIFGGIRRCRIS